MGAILGKFRKEKTTIEILEKLDADIKEIEEYTISTQARQKRYVGNLLVISIGLYILCFLVFYFAFFPPTWLERITYSVPLLIFPLFIFLLKHLVAWFFQRKLNKKSVKLSKLRNEKKKVLEKVMDKETYKVALEILNRFGDKSNGLKGTTQIPSVEQTTPVKSISQTPLQRPQPHSQTQNLIRRPSPGSQILQRGSQPNSPGVMASSSTPLSHIQALQQRASPMPMQMLQMQQQRRRTPYPILRPQDKGVLDKLVDYLIGDGIQNRFAMICKECFGHNGMALQEEYEYTSFRCIYCNAMNPSKKSRPIAPKLPSGIPSINLDQSSNIGLQRSDSTDSAKTSSSEKYSGSEKGGSDSETEKLKASKENLASDNLETKENKENPLSTANDIDDDKNENMEKPIIEKKED